MQLKNISIHKGYGSDNSYNTTIEFTNAQGDIKLRLPQEASERVLAVIADLLVEQSKAVAQQLTSKIIEAVSPQLPKPIESKKA